MKTLFSLFGFSLVKEEPGPLYQELELEDPNFFEHRMELLDKDIDGQEAFDICREAVMNDYENTINIPKAVLYTGLISAEAKLLYAHILDCINQLGTISFEYLAETCYASYEYGTGEAGIYQYFTDLVNELKTAGLITEIGLEDKQIVICRPPVFSNNPQNVN